MAHQSPSDEIERLEPFVGEWQMHDVFPTASPIDDSGEQGAARTVFEWLPGRQFVVQRWEVPNPAAPTGWRSSALIPIAVSTCSTTSTRAASLACTR
jgi:hypothetical protein